MNRPPPSIAERDEAYQRKGDLHLDSSEREGGGEASLSAWERATTPLAAEAHAIIEPKERKRR